MRIGIDATNVGGGGGVTHLKEILNSLSEIQLSVDIEKITVFSSQNVLNQLPDFELLDKLTHKQLNKNIFHRIYFQLFLYDKEIYKSCDILFSITGDYIGGFKPIVSMSQNMLLYERDIWKEIKEFKEILRFWLIFKKQQKSFKNASGIIFISNYAFSYIGKILDLKNKSHTIINHGIANRFLKGIREQKNIAEYTFSNPFKFIYVSTVHVYKNQWNVVEAISQLRKLGYPVELNLVGSVIFAPAGKKLESAIKKVDKDNEFIHNYGHISYENIDDIYNLSDGVIFASTCENMPNILIESMGSGLAIACSDKEPMPEFLKENGFYFDAHNVDAIVSTLRSFLDNPDKRQTNASNAFLEANKYSWDKTSKKTFEFIINTFQNYNHV
jgi:glycosyltransferase involved in cell wall biosynthesis